MSNNLTFTTIAHGTNSGFEEATTMIFRSSKTFASFWKQHGSNSFPPPDIPKIDFEVSMIACVFRGTQNTGGYGVEVTSVKKYDDDGHIEIRYETKDPPPYAITTQALTQPFHIIRMKASDQKVRFVETAAPLPPTPFPVFMLTFERQDGTHEGIIQRIRDLDSVREVETLFTGSIAMVHFNPKKIDKLDGFALLEGMDGVATVEADPPLQR